MPEKLFYQDPYLKEFTAEIIRQEQDDEGNWYAILTKTAFYPTGGGQPFDTGTLNDIRVTKVEEADGEIRHYVEEKLERNCPIIGVIDWDRRFDHMQQHSGQHILTAAFFEKFQSETVSFHLGRDTCTIDLNVEKLSEEILEQAEKRANEIVRENRPILTKWTTKEEASQYPLRKQLSVNENVRLVIIPEFDYNGCGGTHPLSTGEVGAIKILGWERQKGKARVEFVCGERVLRQLQRKHVILQGLSQMVSASEEQMIQAVNQLLENNKEQAKMIAELREERLSFEAEQLKHQVSNWSGKNVISKVFQNRPIQELQKLAKLIANMEAESIIFFVAENQNQLQLVCARGHSGHIQMNHLLKQILPFINGKGGGTESFSQGGGEAIISGEEIIGKLKNELLKREN